MIISSRETVELLPAVSSIDMVLDMTPGRTPVLTIKTTTNNSTVHASGNVAEGVGQMLEAVFQNMNAVYTFKKIT